MPERDAAYLLLRDIVWSLEPYDARDSEWGYCLICQGGSEFSAVHEPDCAYVKALAYVNAREERDADAKA